MTPVDPALMRALIDNLQTAVLTVQRVAATTRLQMVDISVAMHAVRRAIVDMQRMQPPPPEQKGGGR